MLYPENFEVKIGFDKIKQLLATHCSSTLGTEKVEMIKFTDNFPKIENWLALTGETMRLLTEKGDEMPLSRFYDIRNTISRIKAVGQYITEVEAFEIRQAVVAVREISNFIKKQEQELFPQLFLLTDKVENFDLVIKNIDQIFDKFGHIKDNASPELRGIRMEIFSVQSSISKLLTRILKQAQSEGFVEKDTAPAMREGRLVIPVLPTFKRKISGIVHDESASGKTVYIEPTEVMEANNKVRELQRDERREIIKILTQLTEFLRPFFPAIKKSQYYLGEIDFLLAKAKLSIELNAIIPLVKYEQNILWREARHPLLYFSLQKQNKPLVPLDIALNADQRIILISGPNAGGKSVCLKTVALLQYMLQCGIPIPVHPDSEAGIFQDIFIDIGDDQSIENDLSTYSSHLLNMKFFIKNSNRKSILLIDEFGSGTEPQIGGAIAESCLEKFVANGAFGVITTHYSNLKHYAEDAPNIVNGAMLYDRHHLQPLYKLQIGIPGSSFAIEIARKIGLPAALIDSATEKVGAEHIDFDKHIQDIARDKNYWEKKRREIRRKEIEIGEKLERYNSEIKSVEKKKKEIIKEAEQRAKTLISDTNAVIEKTVKTIKEAKAEKEKTQEARKNLETFKEKKIEHKYKSKKEKSNYNKNDIEVGDLVKIIDREAKGEVINIDKKLATLYLGNIKTVVKIEQLELVSKHSTKSKKQNKATTNTQSNEDFRQKRLNFNSKIDLRGMRGEDALQAVIYFLDDATLMSVDMVKILHGTGTGVLKKIIREYLDTAPMVKSYRDEDIQLGGAGITIVNL